MAEFLELLALYYLCDATALVRPMAGDEVQVQGLADVMVR